MGRGGEEGGPEKATRATEEKEMRRAMFLFLFFILGAGLSLGQESGTFGDPLFWDANPEPDVVDYRMFRSDSPCLDATPSPGTCPTFVEQALVGQGTDPRAWAEPGPIVFVQDYYYRVTARNTSGLESQFSNELNVRWLNPNAPSAPGSLRGTEQGANLWLDWDEPDLDEQVEAWRIYKSTEEIEVGGLLDETWETEYRAGNPGRIGPSFYNVTAVNNSGAESEPAGPIVYRGKSQ